MLKDGILANASEFFNSIDQEMKDELELETLKVDIACKFLLYRDENGLSQKQLAKILNISQSMVSKLESGDYNPTIELLFRISKKLNWKLCVNILSHEDDFLYNYTGGNDLKYNSSRSHYKHNDYGPMLRLAS